uniref:Uncharacterized protein n=1 Tax=Caenorhabditis tropicalis TaxID=1561998 RepID=A0A1I7U7W0_9PELO
MTHIIVLIQKTLELVDVILYFLSKSDYLLFLFLFRTSREDGGKEEGREEEPKRENTFKSLAPPTSSLRRLHPLKKRKRVGSFEETRLL